MEEFTFVHIQKNTGDFAGQLRLSFVDKRVNTFPDHVILFLGGAAARIAAMVDLCLAGAI